MYMSLKYNNFFKLNLLQVFSVIHKYSLMCLPQTYLDISTSDSGSNLKVRGYVPVRLGHP